MNRKILLIACCFGVTVLTIATKFISDGPTEAGNIIISVVIVASLCLAMAVTLTVLAAYRDRQNEILTGMRNIQKRIRNLESAIEDTRNTSSKIETTHRTDMKKIEAQANDLAANQTRIIERMGTSVVWSDGTAE